MAPLLDSVLAGAGALVGFLALTFIQPQLPLLGDLHELVPGDLKCICPPLAATACLLFCLPPSDKGPQSPRNIVLSHLLASVVSLAVVLSGIPQGPAVAVALSIAGMKLTDTVHPPAAPYAFVFTSSKWGVQQIFAPGLLGALILIAVHRVWIATTAAIAGGGKAKAA